MALDWSHLRQGLAEGRLTPEAALWVLLARLDAVDDDLEILRRRIEQLEQLVRAHSERDRRRPTVEAS
jgi:Asp-tRNA(Asn)/Glu-tRNA(Gln) amidotransferase A subunit family amidase